MALPKQVQLQADAVEQYDRELQEAAGQAPSEPAPEEAQVPQPTIVAEPPSTPEPVAQPEPPKPQPDPWEHRYKTLQGMYGSLQTQNRDLHDQLRNLQSEVRNLQVARTEPSKTERPALVTPKDVEAFGEDLIDVVRRAAREEFAPEREQYKEYIAALEKKLTDQVGAVQEGQQRGEQDKFFDRLTQAIPNWEEIQATQDCQEWLGGRPPGSRNTWNDILRDAAARHDAQAAVEIFRAFDASRPQPQVQAAPAKPQASNELQRQVTPSKSKASAPTAAQPRIYAASEYEAESMKLIKLRKTNRHDEAQTLENELNAALQEGRIRP